MAGNSRRSQWFGSLAAGTLAALATLFIWQAGAEKSAKARDFSYLDHAAVKAAQPADPTVAVHPATNAAPVPADRAKAPRAVGVANGSYDTKVDGSTFVFGAPASATNPFSLRFGPVVVRSGEDLLTGGNVGDYDVANGGFEANRGGIAERYMYDTNRVEQIFVIPTKPEPASAIEVASPIGMPTAAKVEVVGYGWHDARFTKGGLRFLDNAGSEVAAIYGARAVDADGRQQDLAMGWENGAMTMTVPASFVAIATFPITVDPWIELASSGTVGIPVLPSGSNQSALLAISGAGTPIVGVASDPPAGGDILVAAFNSGTGAWSGFGGVPKVFASLVDASTINDLVCPASLNPIVVWSENVGMVAEEIYLARWNGVAWVGLGGSMTGGGISGTPLDASNEARVALDPAGNPIVAWLETEPVLGATPEVYVRRYDAATDTWVNMGASDSGTGISGSFGTSASELGIAIDPLGRAVVAWVDGVAPRQDYLRRFNPLTSTWDEIAGSASGTGFTGAGFNCGRPDIGFDAAGEPMVVYPVDEGGGNTEIYFKKYDSLAGTWGGLGGSAALGGLSATAGFSSNASLGVDASGVPTIAWREQLSVPVVEIYARRFDGTAWVQLEGSASGSGISAGGVHAMGPSLAMRPDGYPAVAWIPLTLSPVLFRQYDGIPVPTGAVQTQVVSPFASITTGTGTSATASVRLAAVIPAGIPTLARLQVEIQPAGTAFTGIPTAESSLLSPGTLASVIVPLTPGGYQWQYRVQAADPTVTSFYTEFVAGLGADFNIGTTPTAPLAADLSQHHIDTGVAIASGGTTLSGGVIFRYTPSVVATETLRLQVDFTGDGVVDVESPLTAPSTTISISVPLPISAGYNWTARLTNAAGVQSTATAFLLGPPDFIVAAAPAPTTSAVLSLPTQTRTDLTAIVGGGVTAEPMVVLGARITGTVGELVRLQFDVEPTASLDLVPDFETPLVAIPGAGFIDVTYTIPLGEGAYEWAVRAQNSLLVNTAYTAGTGSSPDFNVDTTFAGPSPAVPTVLAQRFLDGTTPIVFGGSTLEGAAIFRATLPASTDMVRLQLEIQNEGSAFVNLPDFESPLFAGGTVVDIVAPIGIGSFKWQVRTFSSALTASAWAEFSLAVPGPDFVSPATPSVPPAAPSAPSLAQKNLDGTVIVSGGTAFSNTVLFEALVPGLVTEVNRIQFDIELIGVGPDGVPDVESPLVAGGSTVSVAVPLGVGSYLWQARAIGPTGLFSAYTTFGGVFGTDFIVTVGSSVPPTAPVTLSQKNVNGTAIVSGGTANTGEVVFEVVVPGAATELNRVQIDVEPTASPLDLQPNAESPLVAGGTTVKITVPFGLGGYNWAARTQSSLGLNSGWTAMPGGPADFVIATGGASPLPPVTMSQKNPSGSIIPTGTAATGSIVVFEVLVPGAATDMNRVQIDVETTGTLDSIPDVESGLVAGGTTVQVSVPLADAGYDWQVRTQSAGGASSAFTPFSGASPDFIISTGATPPAPPSAPVTLTQLNLDGSAIGLGLTAAGGTVAFQVVVPGAPGDLNRIQISYAAGVADLTPELESPLVPFPSTVTMTAPLAAGSYNWQARTVSSFGLFSGYTAFSGSSPDFIVAVGGLPPAAPLAGTMFQQNPDASPILSAATAAGSIVEFKVTVPGLASELSRIQVDVETAGGLDSIPDVESSLVPGGTVVTISVPLANGFYDWQARIQSSGGAVSGYTAFPGGVPSDFRIDTTTPPPATPPVPVSLFQNNLNGSPLALGGTAVGNIVVFNVVVPGLLPGDQNRIQISYAAGVADATPEVESPLVLTGSTVTLTVPLGIGAYNWQARTQSSFGVNSAYTAFDASTPDFVIATGGVAPTAPVVMAQQNPDATAILSGATAAGSIVVFQVTVPGAATDLNRVQVDVESAGLDGVPDVESSLVTGGTVVTISVPLANGFYDWQARTQSSTGAVSGYTAFAGGPSDFRVDTTVPAPAAPAAPATLTQRNLDGTVIALAGTAAGNTVRFEVVVPGLVSDLNRIQVSYAIGAPDLTPEVESPLVFGGSTVTMTVPLGTGAYNWQARTQSSFGLNSAYTAFDASTPDFVIATGGATPTAPLAGGMAQQNPDATTILSG
ncbi:MAG: hypothetical protein K8T20_20520, partial [Planctomycetes bacterium]|nr:hypothetical protein [Planctomycetota bacterium]